MKRLCNAVGCKDKLFFEPQHVHRDFAIILVERTKRLDLFGFRNQIIAQGEHLFYMFIRVLAALSHNLRDFFVSH